MGTATPAAPKEPGPVLQPTPETEVASAMQEAAPKQLGLVLQPIPETEIAPTSAEELGPSLRPIYTVEMLSEGRTIPFGGDPPSQPMHLGQASRAPKRAECLTWLAQFAEMSEHQLQEMQSRSDTMNDMLRSFPDALKEDGAVMKDATLTFLERLGPSES